MAKTLIAFFSRADENYFGGAMRYVKVGNTEIVCEIIRELTGADSFKIEMKEPYSPVYMTCIEEAKRDLREKARPELTHYPDNLDAYDTVILAYPNYWGTIPMAVATFLEPAPEADDTYLPDYSMLFVPALLDYCEASGDLQSLRELWPTALRQLELANERLQNGVFPDSDRLGWCFIDWSLELNKQAALMGVYLYCLRAGEQIAALLSDPVQAVLHERRSAGLRAARSRYWDETLGCFVSGSARQISWASQIWMVLGGVLSKQESAALLTRMERMEVLRMITPYAYHHYVQALLEIGQEQKALSVLKQYWGGMVEHGADTFWELYNPENPKESPYGGTIVNSYCHAWSCGPAWFLRRYGPDCFFSKHMLS